MDLVKRILQLSNVYDDNPELDRLIRSKQITTASNINRPRQAQVRQIFEDFNERNPLADGGMLVKPSTDGSRPGFARSRGDPKIALTKSGEPRKGSAEKFRTYLRGLDKEVLKNSTLEDLVKNSKLNYSKTAASNVLQEDEFLKIRPKRTLNAEDKKEIKKLLKGKTGRLKSITYKGTDYYQGSDGRIREKINLKADRPEAYEIKKEREAKVRDLTKPKDVFPGITATDKNLNLQIWRDLYDSTKKRTYGPRAGDYKPPEPRLKVLTRPKNLTIDSVKTKLVLLDTKTNKKITFKNLEKYIDSLPDTSFKEMSLPYKYKNWLSSQTINYKGRTGVSLRTVLRENLLTKGELTNWKNSPYQVHHPFGKNENPFKVQLAMHKPNGLEGNIRLETLKQLDKAGTNEKDVKKILNNFEKRIKNLGGIQSGVRDVLVGEALTPDRFLKNLFAEAKIGRETRPLFKNIGQVENLNIIKNIAKLGGGKCATQKFASGGRINLADSITCIKQGLENIKNKNLSGGPQQERIMKNLTDLTKTTQGAKALSGAARVVAGLGVGSELALGGFFALTDYATGANKQELISNLTYGLAGKDVEEQLTEKDPMYGKAQKLEDTYTAYLQGLDKTGKPKTMNPRGMAQRTRAEDVEKAMEPFQRISPQTDTGQFFDLDMFETQKAKDIKALEDFEKEKKDRALKRGFYDPDFDVFSPDRPAAAGGGLLKQAGDRSGAPPESGPTPHGLPGILKRAMKVKE